MRNLYDFRAEWSKQEGKKIALLRDEIETLPNTVTVKQRSKVKNLMEAYENISKENRFYIFNWNRLEDAQEQLKLSEHDSFHTKNSLTPPKETTTNNKINSDSSNKNTKKESISQKKASIDSITKPTVEAEQTETKNETNSKKSSEQTTKKKQAKIASMNPEKTSSSAIEESEEIDNLLAEIASKNGPILSFSQSQREQVDSLPTPLTTKEYVTVLKLIYQLENAEPFQDKEFYSNRLQAAKVKIEAILEEIASINEDIKETLYPFEEISIEDKKNVYDIYNRCISLSPYDQKKIQQFEDVKKAKTQIDNLEQAVYVSIGLFIFALIVGFIFVIRMKKRKQNRRRQKMLDETENETILSDQKLI